ncbi:hypothetical protein YC2023_087878 [Brassica napus]
MLIVTLQAKFLAVSTLIPWALDILAHDYVLMPFLDRLPLASQTLDVRRSQKLEMVKELNREKARYHLEVEIGKSPLLSDDDLWWELRGLELREEWRLENRKAFANIWSGMVFGISLFALLYANQGTILNLDREALLEIIMEHYGLEVEKYTITIFICLVPVVMDACVKLWHIHQYYTRLLKADQVDSFAVNSYICDDQSASAMGGGKEKKKIEGECLSL